MRLNDKKELVGAFAVGPRPKQSNLFRSKTLRSVHKRAELLLQHRNFGSVLLRWLDLLNQTLLQASQQSRSDFSLPLSGIVDEQQFVLEARPSNCMMMENYSFRLGLDSGPTLICPLAPYCQ